MMCASFLVYFLTYVKTKNSSKIVFWILSLLLSAGSLYFDRIIFACIVGAFVCYYEESLQKLFKSKAVLIVSGLLSLALCFAHSTAGAITVFSWLIIAMPGFMRVKSFLETKLFGFFGEISFGIYSFHWPLFCSCGAWIMIMLWDKLGGGYAIVLAIAASAAAAILISVGFRYIA